MAFGHLILQELDSKQPRTAFHHWRLITNREADAYAPNTRCKRLATQRCFCRGGHIKPLFHIFTTVWSLSWMLYSIIILLWHWWYFLVVCVCFWIQMVILTDITLTVTRFARLFPNSSSIYCWFCSIFSIYGLEFDRIKLMRICETLFYWVQFFSMEAV
jgi:hypothetical protein